MSVGRILIFFMFRFVDGCHSRDDMIAIMFYLPMPLITNFLFLLSCLVCSQISQMLGNELKFAVREPVGLR